MTTQEKHWSKQPTSITLLCLFGLMTALMASLKTSTRPSLVRAEHSCRREKYKKSESVSNPFSSLPQRLISNPAYHVSHGGDLLRHFHSVFLLQKRKSGVAIHGIKKWSEEGAKTQFAKNMGCGAIWYHFSKQSQKGTVHNNAIDLPSWPLGIRAQSCAKIHPIGCRSGLSNVAILPVANL